jgi:predicted permease
LEVFFALLLKVAPLYIIMFLGYIAGKFLEVSGQNTAKLMLYIIAPIVFFKNIAQVDFTLNMLALPVMLFTFALFMGLIFLYIGKKMYGDARANVLSMVVATGNTGYFGLPIALIYFDANTVGIYILAMVGLSIYESSVGFYITAKGKHTARESFIKVLRLPTLYSVILGIIFSANKIETPEFFDSFLSNMQGAYVILGMMIIGFGISAMEKWEIDWKFLSSSFIAKFLIWPLFVIGFVMIDRSMTMWFTPNIHQALILLSIVPMPANAVIVATLLNTHPNEVSSTVLASTFFAILYLPIMAVIFLG